MISCYLTLTHNGKKALENKNDDDDDNNNNNNNNNNNDDDNHNNDDDNNNNNNTLLINPFMLNVPSWFSDVFRFQGEQEGFTSLNWVKFEADCH